MTFISIDHESFDIFILLFVIFMGMLAAVSLILAQRQREKRKKES